MVEDIRAIAIVLLLAALAVVLYLWSKRKDQIPCPECGARVNIYADKCAHCGYEKGEDMESVEPEETEASDDTETDDASEPETEVSDDSSEEPADIDDEAGGEVVAEDVVSGTIADVKDAMSEHNLDPEEVLEAEKEHKDRVTLVDWLEDQLQQH